MSYIETYYRRSIGAADAPRPSLQGTTNADVCIIGGGLAGLTAALTLVRSGKTVVLLEAERIAWGASGRNGGFVSPGFAAGYDKIEQRVGTDQAKALHRLSIEGVSIVSENIEQYGAGAISRTPGILGVVRHEASSSLKARRDRLGREFDYNVEFKSRDEVRALLASPRYYQGLYDPNAFHIDPLAYARMLARAVESLGGRLFERTAALQLTSSEGAQIVKTSEGEARAKDVLITSGGYTGRLIPQLTRSYLPIATYVMVTAPDHALIQSAIRTTAAIGDDRRAGDYYRLVDNGQRILWGGKITTRVSEPKRLGRLLHETMASTYPQLRNLPVETVWSGLMSYARHLMPQIGQLRDGVWYCTAFGGHGLNTTAIGGRVIAEGIAGSSDRYRMFEPFGLVWNGSIVGRAAAQLTYWSYQAADRWRERKAG